MNQQTISGYVAAANRLRGVCAHESEIDIAELGWSQFIRWLIDQKRRWSPATWGLRKAAALCALDLARDEHPDDPEIPIARMVLDDETSEGADKSAKRTSARKAKKFPLEDRLRIFAALELGRSAKARDLADMIRAGCATGLRPVEWRDASLVEPEPGYCMKLVVVNAKSGAVRGHGPMRTLRWRSISIETERSISRMIAMAARFEIDADFERYRISLQAHLHDCSHRLWPNREIHYALYSCRHEAIAEAKRFYSREEVAAMFGHATDASCMMHYPRRRRGTSKGGATSSAPIDLPIPDPEEVARVRRRAEAKLEHLVELRDRASPRATNETEDETTIEPVLEAFPEPPPKNAEQEEAERRSGVELYKVHKMRMNAAFDDLDRSILRARERRKAQEPRAYGGERVDAPPEEPGL